MDKIHKNRLIAYNKNAGKNIKYYRKLKNISQLQIANILGVDKSTVSLYESGKTSIPVKHVCAISDILSIRIELFFENYRNKFKNLLAPSQSIEIAQGS